MTMNLDPEALRIQWIGLAVYAFLMTDEGDKGVTALGWLEGHRLGE